MPDHQQTQKPGKPDSTFQKQAALTSLNSVSHPASIIQRARINPKSLTPADVLQLQRTIGNRAVGRLLSEIRNPSKVQQAPIQRQEVPEEEKEPLQGMFGKEPEEETCPSCVQRQEKPEEEEPLQGKFETIQRQEISEEEEPLQGKMADPVQRQETPEEEKPIQGKMIGTAQRQEIHEEEEPLQKKSENNTGMPDNLKAGVENLSGIDMSDVRVHYNSSKPAEVGALAYTQGTIIHVAPGQERHLPHEAWHVVQQAQGRVKPTIQLKGVAINDDKELEREADENSRKAIQFNMVENFRSDARKLSPYDLSKILEKTNKNFIISHFQESSIFPKKERKVILKENSKSKTGVQSNPVQFTFSNIERAINNWNQYFSNVGTVNEHIVPKMNRVRMRYIQQGQEELPNTIYEKISNGLAHDTFELSTKSGGFLFQHIFAKKIMDEDPRVIAFGGQSNSSDPDIIGYNFDTHQVEMALECKTTATDDIIGPIRGALDQLTSRSKYPEGKAILAITDAATIDSVIRGKYHASLNKDIHDIVYSFREAINRSMYNKITLEIYDSNMNRIHSTVVDKTYLDFCRANVRPTRK